MFKHQLETISLNRFKQQLPLLSIDVPHSQSVTVLFLANTGSRYETAEQEGIAHFFEHMVFKGSQHYPQAQDLSRALDSVGAEFNAFTSKEYTGYYVKTAPANFDLALDVLSDMLFVPTLRQADIDREKGVIIEELNMYKDMPSQYVGDVLEQLLFTDQQLAHDIVGRQATIQSFTSADFQQFLNHYYGPENMLLVVAGALNKISPRHQVLLDKLSLALAKLDQQRGQGVKLPRPSFQPQNQGQPINQSAFAADRLRLLTKPSEQAHFVMAWPALDAHHPDKYALQVLATIVGGNMSARLFTELREKRGLCYYVHSSAEFYHDSGYLAASAGVDTKRVEEAIKVTKNVFSALVSGEGQPGQSGRISEAELLRAKNYLTAKLLLGLETSHSLAQFFGFKQLLSDQILTPATVIKRIEAVTLGDLERLASLIIQPQTLRLAMIANLKSADKIEHWLDT